MLLLKILSLFLNCFCVNPGSLISLGSSLNVLAASTENTELGLLCLPLWSILIAVVFLGCEDLVEVNILLRPVEDLFVRAFLVRIAVEDFIICSTSGQFISSRSCCLCCLVLGLCHALPFITLAALV